MSVYEEYLTCEQAIDGLRESLSKGEKTYDMARIDRAIAVACEAHNGQKRYSGDDYFCHPLRVATILAGLGMDTETIIAAV